LPKLDALACAGLIDALTSIGTAASEAILGARSDDVRIKPDGSPVTAADEAAEAIIRDGLACLAPGVPIISEERWSQENSKPAPEGSSYFLVDPLDGTREFIAGNKEYTVNIAVVTDGLPILGVIMAPALGLLWRGIVGRGAEKMNADDGSSLAAIHTRKRPGKPVIMVSRSHLEARTAAYLDDLPGSELLACGSSMKFCRLAEGSADIYPRLAPTHDWDIAAGHAILKSAGGDVAAPDGSPLAYGTRELLIPTFVARGDPLTA
jgi:3'(2'), 5'-bisphosphate nucleotidase